VFIRREKSVQSFFSCKFLPKILAIQTERFLSLHFTEKMGNLAKGDFVTLQKLNEFFV